jgi:phosphatidylglycerophosphate synthase
MERRLLKSRETRWARRMAGWLADRGITPNAISKAAVGFAVLGGLGFWAAGAAEGLARALLLLLGAAGCQLRLLCNLFDGMVAIEGGRKEPDGPFWNEAPDRAADILILAGAGLGAGVPALGWAAAALAVATAYVRELGRAEGLGADYGGPMAKQHRMAVVTAAAVLAILLPAWPVLAWALWVVVLGAALTVALRARRLIAALKARG